MTRDQNAGRNHKSFERVEQFKIWEQHWRIKILFRKKLRADWIQETLAVVRCKVFIFQFAPKNIKINIYWHIILPAVLYGCETRSFTLRKKRRLMVFENRVLRRIFVPKRNEVTGEWRKLHNEELNDLYSSPNIIWVIKPRRMRWAVHVACMARGKLHIGFWWRNLGVRTAWKTQT